MGPIGFPVSIDCTRTVTDCYRLLAAVRYLLGMWIPEAFVPRLREQVMGLVEEAEEWVSASRESEPGTFWLPDDVFSYAPYSFQKHTSVLCSGCCCASCRSAC